MLIILTSVTSPLCAETTPTASSTTATPAIPATTRQTATTSRAVGSGVASIVSHLRDRRDDRGSSRSRAPADPRLCRPMAACSAGDLRRGRPLDVAPAGGERYIVNRPI